MVIGEGIEHIKNYIKLINRTANILSLPIISKYITPMERLPIDFSELGLEYVPDIIDDEDKDYFYIAPSSPHIYDIFVSYYSLNKENYDIIEDLLKYIPVEELLNMSDDELELLIKL